MAVILGILDLLTIAVYTRLAFDVLRGKRLDAADRFAVIVALLIVMCLAAAWAVKDFGGA